MSAILLHHGVKPMTSFADALVQERLAEFLPRLDNCSFEFVNSTDNSKLWQW